MSAHQHNYRDDNFSLNRADSYKLLLKLEENSFSYAIVHKNSLLVFAENCALSDLDDPDQLFNLLTGDYKKVVVGLPATGLTLVPNSLSGREQIAGFATLLDIGEGEEAFAQTLDDKNIIVYKADAALVAAISKFDLKNTVYTAKGWISAIAITNPPDNYLYLEIDAGTVQFLYFSGGSLRFYNAYAFTNADELAYFTVLVARELNLDQTNTTLILSGDVAAGDKNMTRLAEFFTTVELNNIQVLELPDQIASHSVLALAGLSLCGSSEAN